MGRKYYLDPVTKEKIYIRNTVSKPPVIDVQVDGESVLEDRIARINLSDKQDTLISGANIKTINGESILGPGNITITGGSGDAVEVIKVNGVEQTKVDGVVNLPVPTKTSDLQNDSGFLTSESDPVYTADKPSLALKSEIPTKVSELINDSGFKTTDTTYSISKSGSTITLTGSNGTTTTVEDSDTTYNNATTSADGLMSAADKSKLDGLIACTNDEIDAIFA